ncbi:MAG: hypothetical protein WC551_08875 [Patescibacteria group bacterium]
MKYINDNTGFTLAEGFFGLFWLGGVAVLIFLVKHCNWFTF